MADIDKKLNEVRTKLAAMPFKFKQEKVKITASFGATCFGENDTTETVLNAPMNTFIKQNVTAAIS